MRDAWATMVVVANFRPTEGIKQCCDPSVRQRRLCLSRAASQNGAFYRYGYCRLLIGKVVLVAATGIGLNGRDISFRRYIMNSMFCFASVVT